MSDAPVMSREFADELIKALGLPDHVTEVTLRFAAGEPITAKCTYFPTVGGLRLMVPRLAKFKLVPKESDV